MTPLELFQSGKLTEAVQALGEEVRNHPLDARRRTFLFELLCFAGEYDRALKHLDLLSDASQSAGIGAFLYRSAIHAEKLRQQMFADRAYPSAKPSACFPGIRDGTSFARIADADERIAGSLEAFVAGSYTWIALEQIASIEIPQPRRLRDLLWTPAFIHTAPAYSSLEFGEVLLPVLSPLSWKHPDDAVRLGRCTIWEEIPGSGSVPFGQKLLLIDDQEIPILELGKVELSAVVGESRVASA
jgi:type VI secretion system protein ImpE